MSQNLNVPLSKTPMNGKQYAEKYDEIDPEFASYVRHYYGDVDANEAAFYDMVRQPYLHGHKHDGKKILCYQRTW